MTRNSRNPRHRRRVEASITQRNRMRILIGCAIVFIVLLIIAIFIIFSGNRNNNKSGESLTEAYDIASSEKTVEPKEKVSFVLTALR